MKVSGEFTTTSSVGALRTLDARPERLAMVPTLVDVEPGTDGSVSAVFTPATPFGRAPIAVRIVPEQADDNGAMLRVYGRRGAHAIDVLLTLGFKGAPAGTTVRWDAVVAVRGPAASVSQRVACDIARRAIDDVLVSVAACAEKE